MYAYIQGRITEKTPTAVIIEAGGVGYDIQISLNTFSHIEHLTEVKLWTQLIVREDSQTLFGFFEKQEKSLFALLLSVSGIGPNTARLLLSGMTPGEAREAILSENIPAFKRVKGVGPKTAKRLILELKDKLVKDGADVPEVISPITDNSAMQEALFALLKLGFQRNQVQKALRKIAQSGSVPGDTEGWIKAGLKALSG